MIFDNFCISQFTVSPFCLKKESLFVLEVRCSGCNFHCKGCFVPELQRRDYFPEVSVDEFTQAVISEIDPMIIGELHILGGEPLLDENRINFLSYFLHSFRETFQKSISVLLFTGYKRRELLESELFDSFKTKLLPYLDYIKFGRYRKDLPPRKVSSTFQLASCNQFITDNSLKVLKL